MTDPSRAAETSKPPAAAPAHDGGTVPAAQVERSLLDLMRQFDPLAQEILDRSRGTISLVQLRALRALSDGPCTISELASTLRNHESTVSRLVDRLQTAGLVERAQDIDDRRVVKVTLSGAGRKTLDRVTAHRRAVAAEVAKELSEGDRAVTRHVLETLTQLLSKYTS